LTTLSKTDLYPSHLFTIRVVQHCAASSATPEPLFLYRAAASNNNGQWFSSSVRRICYITAVQFQSNSATIRLTNNMLISV